jgi:hypothetical protein
MADTTATFKDEFSQSTGIQPAYDPATEHIVQVLGRYPYISPGEATDIVKFLKTARYREVVQLTSDRSVRRQLDDFVRGRRRELNDLANPIAAIGLALLFLAGCWALWQPLA